ncbi:MAG: hypothetical protein Q4E02_05760 [Lagierella massiliensis]|nr:hypothetical protein [Lagierella massiliensis]
MGKLLDLKGEKFGKLIVIHRIEDRDKEGYAKWLCKCECGGEIIVNSKQLQRGTITSCGCIPKKNARNGNKAENLIGKRFGLLTVIERVENKNDRVSWLCKCDCGKEKICTAQSLKAGKVKSCGCLRGAKNNQFRDISGKKFGFLLAISPTNERDKKGSIKWKCLCDCGNECLVTEDALVHGNTTSCGCKKKEWGINIYKQVNLYQDTSYTFLKFRKNVREDNQCGVRGITQLKNGKFRAYIGFKKKRYYLGTYSTQQEALDIRRYAEEILHEGFCRAFERWKILSREDEKWESENPLIYEVNFQNKEFYITCNIEELEKKVIYGTVKDSYINN